jgi:hypothetical protein
VARRIVIALIVTIALLGAARRLTSGKPRDVHVNAGDVQIWHRTVTAHYGSGQPIIEVKLEAPPESRIVVHFKTPDNPKEQKRGLVSIGNGRYIAHLPPYDIGARIRYALVLTKPDGSRVRVPSGDRYYVIKFKGRASQAVLAAHIVCMFAAFFFMVLTLFGAIRILRGFEDKRRTVSAARWALFLSFIGGWPLGLILNKQTFGVAWEGYPFGYDITDNKTQIVFIFWLVSLLLVWGSFVGRGEDRDRIGRKGFAWSMIACFFVSLALYILPHSL